MKASMILKPTAEPLARSLLAYFPVAVVRKEFIWDCKPLQLGMRTLTNGEQDSR